MQESKSMRVIVERADMIAEFRSQSKMVRSAVVAMQAVARGIDDHELEGHLQALHLCMEAADKRSTALEKGGA